MDYTELTETELDSFFNLVTRQQQQYNMGKINSTYLSETKQRIKVLLGKLSKSPKVKPDTDTENKENKEKIEKIEKIKLVLAESMKTKADYKAAIDIIKEIV